MDDAIQPTAWDAVAIQVLLEGRRREVNRTVATEHHDAITGVLHQGTQPSLARQDRVALLFQLAGHGVEGFAQLRDLVAAADRDAVTQIPGSDSRDGLHERADRAKHRLRKLARQPEGDRDPEQESGPNRDRRRAQCIVALLMQAIDARAADRLERGHATDQRLDLGKEGIAERARIRRCCSGDSASQGKRCRPCGFNREYRVRLRSCQARRSDKRSEVGTHLFLGRSHPRQVVTGVTDDDVEHAERKELHILVQATQLVRQLLRSVELRQRGRADHQANS
jgi:ribosomal protein L37E